MAVVQERPVRVWYFVRLKLRMTGNGLRGSGVRTLGFVLSALFGIIFAIGGFFAFLASGGVGRHDVGLVIATFGGTAVVAGWLLFPLLFFGVDETLDPARFALLPLPRRTLAIGMLAGACVGIPGVATALAFLGLVAAGGLVGGLPGLLVGLVGALFSLLLCVATSRAITSAFAALLRSRRVRDLTAVVLALVAASVGPLQLFLNSAAVHASLAPALRVARILAWTPLAAGFAAPFDIRNGQPLLAVARLAIVAASVVLVLWWWSLTLESAMVGSSAAGPSGGGPIRGGAIRALLPKVLWRARPDTFLGIMARELRYWSRDPRRRSGLISITVGGAIVPVALRLGGSHGGQPPLPLTVAFAGILGAVVLANQFAYDGSAYTMHMLAAVRGRTELRARASALALIVAPILVVITVAVAVFTGDSGELLPALGTVAATFGCSLAVSCFLSILAAYPMPESRYAFAVNTGTGSAKGVLVLVGMLASIALASPILIATVLLPTGLGAVVLPIGIAWGVSAVVLGTYIAGDVLERRGPELLMAVTSGR